jgi:AraC-like DNA-binding protein
MYVNPMKSKWRQTALPPLLLFLAAALLFFLVLSSRFSRFAVSELSRFNQGMAELTAGNTDLLVERLKGFAQNRLEDADLLAWLASSDLDPASDYKAEWGLVRSLAAEPFVAGALFLAPDQGYLLDTRSRRWDWKDYPDRELLDSVSRPAPYLRMQAGPSWLALPLPKAYVPSGSPRSLVLLINRPLFEEYILQSKMQPSFRAFVLDAEGRLILGEAPGAGPWTELLGPKVDGLRKNIGGQSWLIGSRSLEREDWTLVRAVRLEELGEKAVAFQVLLVAILIALVILYWAGLLWSEARLTRPFRTMAEEHRVLARQEALRTLLDSGTLDPREEALFRQDTGFKVDSPFALVAARLESYQGWRASVEPEDQTRLRKEALAVVETLAKARGWVGLGVDQGGDALFWIIQVRGTIAAEHLDALLLEASAALPPAFASCAWAAGEVIPGRDRLRFVADSLRELSYLKFISGEAKVYREEDMAMTLDRQPVHLVQDESETLMQAVRSCHRDELEDAVDRLIEGLKDLPYAECRLQVVMLSFLLFKEFRLQLPEQGGFQGLERVVGSFGSLSEVGAWLLDTLVEVQERLAAPAKGIKRRELVAEVEALVQEELSDFTLNLDRAAARVGLSPGYFRQVFKEAKGESFADYLHRLRIAKIGEQLEHSDLPVARIIERSGFQTKSHFFTAFKETTGMTPEQYRRSKQNCMKL